MKKKIGIAGGGKHAWVSVDRTRRFYLDALAEDFELVFIEDLDQIAKHTDLSALLNFAGNIGWQLPERPPYPVLYCAHGGAILNQDFLYKQLPHLRLSDGIIVNCQSDIDIFRSMCEGPAPNLYKLPLPANSELFYPMEKAMAKDIFGLSEDTLLIGHICRLLPQKNLHGFLHMFAAIKERMAPKSVRGIVVGNFWIDYPVLDYVTEGYPDYIEDLLRKLGLEEDVTILSAKLSDDELTCCYNALDLLIHPTQSLDENFGYVPVEAMACGVPVLGAAYGGLKDTIADSQTGYLMPTWVTRNGIRMDEPYGVARAVELLEKASDNPMYEACLERVEEGFTYEHCAWLLRSFVAKSIQDFEKNTGRVRTRSYPDSPVKDNLPATPSGTAWPQYYNVVSHYVSHKLPAFAPGTTVYPAAPLLYNGQSVTLDDPAWPAAYELNGHKALLETIEKEGMGYEGASEEEKQIIAEWLENGLLSLTKEPTHG